MASVQPKLWFFFCFFGFILQKKSLTKLILPFFCHTVCAAESFALNFQPKYSQLAQFSLQTPTATRQ